LPADAHQCPLSTHCENSAYESCQKERTGNISRNRKRAEPELSNVSEAEAKGSRTPLTIRDGEVDAKSRIAGLQIAIMTLRLMEHWRKHLGTDHLSAAIVLATAAITMEKFTRVDFEPNLRNIRNAVPAAHLSRRNVSSIAAAIGANRETTRRKVSRLVEQGMLLKDANGSIRLSPDYTLSVPTSQMVRRQLETLVQAANNLLKHQILASTTLL
jgi:hypothetical protein